MAGAIAGGIGQGLSDIGSTVANAVLTHQMMKWQEKMRATAYQTMVEDLGKAGLNPALAFGGGHAALAGTPSPTVAKIAQSSDVMGAVQKGIASAKQARAVKDELATVAANRQVAENEALFAGPRANAEIDLMDSEATRNFESAKLNNFQALESAARTKEVGEREISVRVNRMLGEAELPGAQAKGEFDKTPIGGVLREVRRVLDAVPSMSGGRSSSARGGRSSYGGRISP